MPTKASLIFNPVAGRGDPEQDLATIQTLLEPIFTLEIHRTEPDTDIRQLTQTVLAAGAEVILAAGGDGTISAATSTLIGTNIPLGIIPCGTANAFANAIGLPTSLEGACRVILGGVTRPVDVATCNGKPMILKLDIGIGAEAIAGADREAKNRFGTLAYILAGMEQLRNLELFETEIETDDRVIRVSAAAIVVANAAPPTSILAQGPAEIVFDDGLLDLTIIAPENLMHSLAIAYELFSSALAGHPSSQHGVGFLRNQSFKINTNPPQKVYLDGDLMGMTPVEVICIHQGLTIFSLPQEDQPIERLEGLPDLMVEYKK